MLKRLEGLVKQASAWAVVWPCGGDVGVGWVRVEWRSVGKCRWGPWSSRRTVGLLYGCGGGGGHWQSSLLPSRDASAQQPSNPN